MEYIGYIAAIIIGISLGVIGAGGSILTIPVLVYLIGIPPINATSYSLFIVGVSSLVGSITYFKNNLVSLKTVLSFGVPSIISVFLTRKFILHTLPTNFHFDNIEFTKNTALMILLAVLMILSSYSMIKSQKSAETYVLQKNKSYQTFMLFLQGISIGFIVALVGAGGGFLIIPALVILARLPMKNAIGTALAIIMLNSWVGFFSDFKEHQFDWKFLIAFSTFAVIGIFIGGYISKFISSSKLKPMFGWFVLVTGTYIILKEFFF